MKKAIIVVTLLMVLVGILVVHNVMQGILVL